MGLWQGHRKGGNMKLSLHRRKDSDGALLSTSMPGGRLWPSRPNDQSRSRCFKKLPKGPILLHTYIEHYYALKKKGHLQDSTFGSLQERDGPSASLGRLRSRGGRIVPCSPKPFAGSNCIPLSVPSCPNRTGSQPDTHKTAAKNVMETV